MLLEPEVWGAEVGSPHVKGEESNYDAIHKTTTDRNPNLGVRLKFQTNNSKIKIRKYSF
jgi:hypothetical protein